MAPPGDVVKTKIADHSDGDRNMSLACFLECCHLTCLGKKSRPNAKELPQRCVIIVTVHIVAINQILGLIRRNITYKGKKLIILLYKAIVRPHLEYCIQAWRPYRKKDIDTLERIQRRATKMIPELRDLSYEERLKECGLTTLETRRLRGDQIEVFKILNGYENIDRNMFFSLKKDSRTRGHEVKLVKDQCRLDIRKHSFS